MPIPRTPAHTRRPLLRDEVYARLRDAIVDGTFAPGEQLRDADVAQWLGVSRTPVREALLQLSQAGLVVARPGRSTSVATLDAREIRDAREVVASMHELAVRQSVTHLTDEDLATMRAANERFADALRRSDVDAALAADADFHGVPVACSANKALRTVLDQFEPAVRRLERLRFSSVAGRDSVALHRHLIQRCAAGDVEGAAAVAFETWHSLTDPTDDAVPAPGDEP